MSLHVSFIVSLLLAATAYAGGTYDGKRTCGGDYSRTVLHDPRHFMQRMLRYGASSPAELKVAASALEKMARENPTAFEKWMKLAEGMLESNLTSNAVRGNLEHVYSQHLAALERDAKELSEVFGIDPKVLKLLMVMHDLGKVKQPDALTAVLGDIKPELFPAGTFPEHLMYLFNIKGVLAHEYGSMYWAQTLGQTAGAKPEEIEAVQRLISNHNFGVDPTTRDFLPVAEHFWPMAFRNLMIPAFQHLGFDVSGFPIGPGGVRQYGRSNNIYSDLLSLYDRVGAQPVSPEHPRVGRILPGGLANLRKFQVEAFQFNQLPTIRAALAAGQTPKNPFDGVKLMTKMQSDALQWRREYTAMWAQVYGHLPPGQAPPASFGPQQRQLKALQELDLVMANLYRLNNNSGLPLTEGKFGYAYYQRPNGGPLMRVAYEPGMLATVSSSTDGGKTWKSAGDPKITDTNPYQIFFKLMEEDIRWDHPDEWSPYRTMPPIPVAGTQRLPS